jgi:hypothetical protein
LVIDINVQIMDVKVLVSDVKAPCIRIWARTVVAEFLKVVERKKQA